MRNFTFESYKTLVEGIDDEAYQAFMKDEIHFIINTPGLQSRTVVDLGAGYGRVLPNLAATARDVVAVEINPDMYLELEHRAAQFPNATAIKGDFFGLDNILPANVHHPLFLILQNTLGTIEGGTASDVLSGVMRIMKEKDGELILGLFRQQALRDWGVEIYGKEAPMVGNVDLEKSDFINGVMVTDTGYTSKWWTDEDLSTLRRLGSVERELLADQYALMHLTP
jgi:SAM-dependent methyltransferase